MCSFCNDNTLDGLGTTFIVSNNLNDEDKLILDLWGENLEITLYNKQSNKESFDGVLRIYFCPMCGGKVA